MQLFLKMRFDEGVKCVNIFFKTLKTSKKCETENGHATFHVFLNLPIHGISCPVDARKLVLKFPFLYDKLIVERDVIIFDMANQIIIQKKFSTADDLNTFLSENFRRTDAQEELVRINERLDEFLKMYKKV